MEYIIQILVMFILTIGMMRLMGKSTIVQLTPYDLVALIIIGTIIAEPLISAEFVPAIKRAGVLLLLYLIFARLSLNQFMNKFLLGEPSILIKHGKIIEDVLEKEHISLIQLLATLRTAGYSKLDEVEYAILEPTGTISVIPVPDARLVTLADLNIKGEYEGLPLAVIIDGQIQCKNLKLIHKDPKWLKTALAHEGIRDLKDVLYAFVDDRSEKIHYALHDDPCPEPAQPKESKPSDKTKHPKAKREWEKTISLVEDGKIQLAGLKEAHLTQTDLLDLLNVPNMDEIQQVLIEQRMVVKKQ